MATQGWDPTRAVYLLSLPVFVVVWVWLLLECLTWGRAAKPVLGVLLVLSAAAAYYMSAYGVVFDRAMITNIVETDPAEAAELLNARMVGWLLFLGIAPLGLLARARVRRHGWRRQILVKATTIGVLICAIAVLVAPSFQSYAALLRNHRELRLSLVPANYLAAAHSYLRTQLSTPDRLEAVTNDAKRALAPEPGAKPTLTVLVIGETARAANFQLNGYSRPTTPRLAAETDLIHFRDVSSCGTSTAVSLPCMFLDVGRSGFSDTLARRRENLLDALQRAGFDVLWRDNNSGCKGICDRAPSEDLTRAVDPALCGSGECYDEVLLTGLQDKLDAFKRDTVIVLHMKGSHGPAYHLRYPPAFERFKPVCRDAQFDRCERQAIVNAYDNTLLYTDYVISRTIELLRRNSNRFTTSLVYVSDHGESLGERGLYLHGVPYALAPAEQTHVPLLMWFSAEAQKRFGVDMACLRHKEGTPASHDNLYHSTLGLLEVQTRVYRPDRDLFRSCRTREWELEARAEQPRRVVLQ